MAIKHAFTSAVPDGGNSSLVQPSDWNDDHVIENDLALPGNPTTTTQSAGNNSTRIATTAFVAAAIAALIGTAPSTLDTLGEISDALNDDANLYSTLLAAIAAAVNDTAYGSGWNGDTTHAPSKNAVYDKIEALVAGAAAISDAAYGSGWNGDTTNGASKNAIYDKIEAINPVGKQTIYIPASAMIPATTSGPASAQVESSTNKINYAVLDFDGSSRENAHFNVAFPKSWDEGTVTFKAFWETTNASTNGVAWGLEAIAISDGDTIDTAYGTAVYVVDNGQSSATKRYISAESGGITIGGSPAAGDIVNFRVHRDPTNGSDDMTQDARLVGIQLFYTTDAGNDA